MSRNNFSKAYKLGKILWDYFELKEPLNEADFILALGNFRLKDVAKRSAELYKNGLGKFIVVSGGVKRTVKINGKTIKDTEANILKRYLLDFGIEEEKIILENKARTTGGNFIETLKLLNENTMSGRSCIAVTMPFVERRARATADRQTPQLKTQITSFNEDYDIFVGAQKRSEQIRLLNVLVGTYNRIQDYPHLGHQTSQKTPNHVKKAAEELISMGYTGDYIRFSEIGKPKQRKTNQKRFNLKLKNSRIKP